MDYTNVNDNRFEVIDKNVTKNIYNGFNYAGKSIWTIYAHI